MGLFDKFRKKKITPNNISRREFLLANGRITEGTILENEASESGDVVYYFYNIQGVDFESSDVLTDEQKANSINYAPGAKVSIRFDPKNHGNCILV